MLYKIINLFALVAIPSSDAGSSTPIAVLWTSSWNNKDDLVVTGIPCSGQIAPLVISASINSTSPEQSVQGRRCSRSTRSPTSYSTSKKILFVFYSSSQVHFYYLGAKSAKKDQFGLTKCPYCTPFVN